MVEFDAAAKNYDVDFTHSPIGIAQRNAIWTYLKESISGKKRILELNGGTGEDAIWLNQQGHEVVCTDVSEEMLKVAKEKAETTTNTTISFDVLDLKKPAQFKSEAAFDLVFSNFAGLNCLSESQLKTAIKQMHGWLKPNGEAILVFLGKYCFWESAYFVLHGKPKAARRRWTNDRVSVNVDGEQVGVWYYAHQDIQNVAAPYFEVKEVKSIGMFVPPSYLNKFFRNRKNTLHKLEGLDKLFGRSAVFSNFSDHFLIHLKRK